ncbi:MAG: DUF4385 domain-containing protein [Tatlockia sp.]|nr:DUF4385 domain-containing protein [Tatlockia sp.]
MSNSYADKYRRVDFKKNPEKYCIGRGEQGVLIAEPYKSEILPHWRFKTPAIAKESATKIYELFLSYKNKNDFVGMDMARKFLQMGFTRSRRYANHASGKKYDEGIVRPQDDNSEESDKAKSAKIFLEFYQKAKNDELYKKLYKIYKALEKENQTDKKI